MYNPYDFPVDITLIAKEKKSVEQTLAKLEAGSKVSAHHAGVTYSFSPILIFPPPPPPPPPPRKNEYMYKHNHACTYYNIKAKQNKKAL